MVLLFLSFLKLLIKDKLSVGKVILIGSLTIKRQLSNTKLNVEKKTDDFNYLIYTFILPDTKISNII